MKAKLGALLFLKYLREGLWKANLNLSIKMRFEGSTVVDLHAGAYARCLNIHTYEPFIF